MARMTEQVALYKSASDTWQELFNGMSDVEKQQAWEAFLANPNNDTGINEQLQNSRLNRLNQAVVDNAVLTSTDPEIQSKVDYARRIGAADVVGTAVRLLGGSPEQADIISLATGVAALTYAGGKLVVVKAAVTPKVPSNGGHFLAGSITEGGTGTALAGHGAKFSEDTSFVVPKGTAITLPRANINILDRTGQYIESGDWEGLGKLAQTNPRVANDIDGMTTWLSGARVPAYTLFPPDWRINLFSNSISVSKPTSLKQILEANRGCIQWAACTEHLNFNK